MLLSHTCHTGVDETRIFVGIYAIDKHGVTGIKPNLCLEINGARGRISMPILGKFKSKNSRYSAIL